MKPAAADLDAVEVWHQGRRVLHVPHLSIRTGEILAVVGPNGAGKSTLLQVLALLQKPSRGRVSIEGREVTEHADQVDFRRQLALVFQEPLLFRGTVFDNVALGLRLRGFPRREIKLKVNEWLERLKISQLAVQTVNRLSAGEAQRVNLARALVSSPRLLLLDEPFAWLDPVMAGVMMEELQVILAEKETTAVWVTHNRAEALMLGHRLAVMIDGEISQLDTPPNVFLSPASEKVAVFLGMETMLRGRVLSTSNGFSRFSVDGQEILVAGNHPEGSERTFYLRPEELLLSPFGGPVQANHGTNIFDAVIAKVTPAEGQFRIAVDCGFLATALVSRQTFIDLSIAKGKKVRLSFKAEAVQVIPARGQPSASSLSEDKVSSEA